MGFYIRNIAIFSVMILAVSFGSFDAAAQIDGSAAQITEDLSKHNFAVQRIVKKKIPESDNKIYYIADVKGKDGRQHKIRIFPDSSSNSNTPFRYFIHADGQVKPLQIPATGPSKPYGSPTLEKREMEYPSPRGNPVKVYDESFEQSGEDRNISDGESGASGQSSSGSSGFASGASAKINLASERDVQNARSNYANGCGSADSLSVMGVGSGLADAAKILGSSTSDSGAAAALGGERTVDRSREYKQSGENPLQGALEKPQVKDSISNQLAKEVNSKEMKTYSNRTLRDALRNHK